MLLYDRLVHDMFWASGGVPGVRFAPLDLVVVSLRLVMAHRTSSGFSENVTQEQGTDTEREVVSQDVPMDASDMEKTMESSQFQKLYSEGSEQKRA